MLLTKKIIDIVDQLDCKNEYLSLEDTTLNALSHGKKLFSVSEEGIFLNGRNVLAKIYEESDGETDTLLGYEKFVQNIAQRGVRLNHVGIQYSCNSIEKEIIWYKENVVDSDLTLFEETSDDEFTRWFFLGNRTDWHAPLFEIVLRENENRVVNDWTPHFQIDIDTNLEKEEIEGLAVSSGFPNFIQWELAFADMGTVLVMGPLGKIGKTSLCLGLGTKKRDVQRHRNELRLV